MSTSEMKTPLTTVRDDSESSSGDDDDETTALPVRNEHASPVTGSDLEEYFEEATRRRVREQRLRRQDKRKQVFAKAAGAFFLLASIAFFVAGIIVLNEAERDRMHGWRQTRCVISRNYGDFADNTTHPVEDGNVCVYFTVQEAGKGADSPDLCAVPASVAARGSLSDPPACSDLSTRDQLDVDFWRIVERQKQMECFVPMKNAVPAERCVTSATTGGPGAAIWRTWLDRMVYLVRDPREGVQALHAATSIQQQTATALFFCGGLALFISCSLLFLRTWLGCFMGMHEQKVRMRDRMRDRHAQRHKLY